MPASTLQKNQLHMNNNNNEQSKIDFLAKFIYTQPFNGYRKYDVALRLTDNAIKTINYIKVYENYMDRYGRLSWDTYWIQ